MSGAQNGNVDLFKMVFSTQRALGLPSKCCDWGMANHLIQGFSFPLSSPGLTWLEHGFCPQLVSPRRKSTQPALCTPVISFLSSHAIEKQTLSESCWLVPKRPEEMLKLASLLCLKTQSVTQNQPWLQRITGIFLIVSGTHHAGKKKKKSKSNYWLMWNISGLLGATVQEDEFSSGSVAER